MSPESSDDNVNYEADVMVGGKIVEVRRRGKDIGRCLYSASNMFTIMGSSFEECKKRYEAFIEAVNNISQEDIDKIIRDDDERKAEEPRASDGC